MNYIKELDGLRAIALLLVVVSHWLSTNALVIASNPGEMGVSTFFVLSGFLITGILLDNRNKAAAAAATKERVLLKFVIRRALRIFPIYYLFIIVLFVFGDKTGTNIRASFPYFFVYLANFYFYKTNYWDGMLSHLWTLSVEEQFYLIWPWVILFVPRRYLLVAITAFIAIGIGTSYEFASPEGLGLALPFTCFDAFGLGALLAFVKAWYSERLGLFYRLTSIAAIIGVFMLVVSINSQQAMVLPDRTVQSVVALWVITYIVYKKNASQETFPVPFLTNRVLVYLGKISYGMYLYHLPLQYDYDYLNAHIVSHLPATAIHHPTAVLFGINFLLLVTLSTLSWRLLERPILRLKQRFEYMGHAPVVLV